MTYRDLVLRMRKFTVNPSGYSDLEYETNYAPRKRSVGRVVIDHYIADLLEFANPFSDLVYNIPNDDLLAITLSVFPAPLVAQLLLLLDER